MFSINRVVQSNAALILRSCGIQAKLGSKGVSPNVTAIYSEFASDFSSYGMPAKLYSLPRSSQFQQQMTIFRHYSEIEIQAGKAEETASAKQKPLSKEDIRWFHPSPSENLENPAYTYLKNHPEYQTMFFQHEVYSRLMTEDGRLTPVGEGEVSQSVKAFIDLCNTNPEEYITDPQYEPIFSDLVSESSKLTDIELLLVIYNLRRLKRPKAKDKDYRKIWQPLDDLCLHRLHQKAWSLEYMFNMADLLYSAGLATESNFHWDLVKRLYRRVDDLSREEFIRMMFSFGGVKSLPDSLSIYNIEYNLPRFIDELTPEEVAVISVGFLRTKTLVNDKEVLKKMLNIVAGENTTVRKEVISAVAKAVTLTPLFLLQDEVYNFLGAFVSEIPRIDLHACAALVLLGIKAKIEHTEFLSAVVKKIEGNVNIMRSKDLEYICSGLSTFNVDCEKLYEEIISDFQTRKLNTPMKSFCDTHGRNFVNILHHLSQRNIYPHDLISFALSDNFLVTTYGRSMYTYTEEVLLLDICTGLEAEGYEGPRLSEKYRQFLTKKNMLWIADVEKATTSEYQKIARYMLHVCTEILGGLGFGHLCNVVPPFRTIGAVYCISEDLQMPVPVPENFVNIDDFDIKYIPETDNNITYHAFVLFPVNYAIANTGKPIGMAEMHCRQMEKMGYTVHPLFLGHTVTSPDEMKEAILKVLGPLVSATAEPNCRVD